MMMPDLLETVINSVTETIGTATETEQVATKLELRAMGMFKLPARVEGVSIGIIEPFEQLGRTTHLVVRWNQSILMLKEAILGSVAPSPPTLNLVPRGVHKHLLSFLKTATPNSVTCR